jgi:hypothetical protein
MYFMISYFGIESGALGFGVINLFGKKSGASAVWRFPDIPRLHRHGLWIPWDGGGFCRDFANSGCQNGRRQIFL